MFHDDVISAGRDQPDTTEAVTAPGRQKPIEVAIVDDEGLFREGLVQLLDKQPDIRVVGTSGNGKEEWRKLRGHAPDILLVGSDGTDRDQLEEIGVLHRAYPLSKIVILAARDDPHRVKHLLSSGAHAYMPKSTTVDELLSTIRVIEHHQDRVVVSVSRETMNGLRANSELLLSTREMEVLTLVAEGMRNSQIARKLFIAEGTVKRHLTNIYAKLGATSRTDAVRRAAKADLPGIG